MTGGGNRSAAIALMAAMSKITGRRDGNEYARPYGCGIIDYTVIYTLYYYKAGVHNWTPAI